MSDPTALSIVRPDWSQDDVQVLRAMICPDASEAEMKLFAIVCKKTGLDPFTRQIYFQKRRNRKTGRDEMTTLTAIDGYRLIADRTGLYAGNDDPVFDDEKAPQKATVTVYKLIGGIRCPFTASARWEQYYPGDAQGFMWRKMPHLMLGKCAEALALRKAFPNELSGVYVKEEMDQADREEPAAAAQDQPRAEPAAQTQLARAPLAVATRVTTAKPVPPARELPPEEHAEQQRKYGRTMTKKEQLKRFWAGTPEQLAWLVTYLKVKHRVTDIDDVKGVSAELMHTPADDIVAKITKIIADAARVKGGTP